MSGIVTSKQFTYVDRGESEYDIEKMGEMETLKMNGKDEKTPKNGQYFFKTRKIYKLKNGNKLSPYWYRWIADTPHRLSFVQMFKGYEFAKRTDHIVPEGLSVNADGNYQYTDRILMRRPLVGYLEERMAMGKEPGKQKKAVINKFKSHAHKFALDMNDEEFEEGLAKMLGDDYIE